jgi:hypothetical protein
MKKYQEQAIAICNANLIGHGMFLDDLSEPEATLVRRVIGEPVVSSTGVTWWPRRDVERAINVLSR